MTPPRTSANGQYYGLMAIIPSLLPAIIATGLLFAASALYGIRFNESYRVLAVLTFLISLFVYKEVSSRKMSLSTRPRDFLQSSITAWVIVVSLLAILGFALQYGAVFSRRVLLTWAVATPVVTAALQYWANTYISHRIGFGRRVVIAGVSELSRRLANTITEHTSLGLVLNGWFEDRSPDRVGPTSGKPILGRLDELPNYVKRNNIDVIYIALPIRHEERTKRLLDDLHDTTASIYFVPDIFVFDLIQSRVDIIGGIPVLALCETPFVGVNGLIKRTIDLMLASLILVILAPVMLFIALGIAVSNPGSVIFKQRRYGLDGHEIIIYKFRTMRTSDDDEVVIQARREDARVTQIGRVLRRYSLDELPQLANVLQGRMSLVGPRPHAIAHNEEYRKLIKGYMIRHKVAPGITGLAQVRGYRGETKTIDQMKARIECDLEYLRNWSVALDFKILAITALRIFRDSKAY